MYNLVFIGKKRINMVYYIALISIKKLWLHFKDFKYFLKNVIKFLSVHLAQMNLQKNLILIPNLIQNLSILPND